MRKLLIFALFLSPLASGAEVPALTDALSSAITSATEGVNSCPAAPDLSEWPMDWVFFTFSPQITFGVSGVVSVSVQPEIDLIWGRTGVAN